MRFTQLLFILFVVSCSPVLLQCSRPGMSVGTANPPLSEATFPHNGHAHNDYEHKGAPFPALQEGFKSLEIDVYLHKEELIVSHFPISLDKKPSIREQYLDPLVKRIKSNGGTVFPGDSSSLILYIDFKTGAGTYDKLAEVIQPYLPYLKRWEGDREIWGPLEFLIDGHQEQVLAQTPRWTNIEKRVHDYADPLPPTVLTRLNDHYKKYFTWKGRGKMPEDQFRKLKAAMDSAHAHGRTVRLYGYPNRKIIWQTLNEAGVDWLNIDKLKDYRKWHSNCEFKTQPAPEH